jgi:hypothetical protein
MEENNSTSYPKMIDDVIENGVKGIKTPNKDGDIKSTLEWMYKNNYQDDYNGSKMINNVIENGVKKTILRQHITDGNVETIIETGIKETQPLPDQSGELIGYGNYYHRKEDRTKAFIDYLEETINFGVKEIYWLPKEHKHIDSDVNPIDDVINNGVKKVSKGGITQLSKINEVIQNGVTNTYPDYMPNEYDWNEDFNVDEVIDKGTLI